MLRPRLLTVIVLIHLSLFGPVLEAGAQDNPIESNLRDSAINYVAGLYHNKVGKESNLYNGRERNPYNFPFLGSNPHFKELTFVKGSIFYDEVLYKEVPLLYDVIRDELILLHYDGFHQVHLVKQKVGWFTLKGHFFINIFPGSANNSLGGGYYEQLYDGGVDLLIKRSKKLSEKIDDHVIYSIASDASVFYLFKNGVYRPVKNSKGLLKLLEDKRAEINRYIRQNKIKFKGNLETSMTRVVAHYDQLNK
ncbi:MAG TPA: hypothetical protein VM935_09025 [Chitinophagaceae bacterium]|jgi:hypothetical protein|nr:hypothetical protein [Chitinophagaceae bacterium]